MEPIERVLVDERRELSAQPERPPGLVEDHTPAGLSHRLEDRFDVQWRERP
jgi:hypothetical protein